MVPFLPALGQTFALRTVDPGGKGDDLILALTGVDTRVEHSDATARPSPDRTCAPWEPGARALVACPAGSG